MSRDPIAGLQGATVIDPSGAKLGPVQEIFLDDQTRKPEWVAVKAGRTPVLVPLAGASQSGSELKVPYPKEKIQSTPKINPGDHIDQATEQKLYSHYGLGYSESRSDSGLPEGAATGTGQEQGSVVRSEEELNVGKAPVQAGQVRLRKYVENEPVTANVELQQEVARVEREAINQPVSGAEIGEDTVEVDLHAERPVVEKQAIAKERVSLDKDVETETAQVSDQLRKERVEVDGEDVRRA